MNANGNGGGNSSGGQGRADRKAAKGGSALAAGAERLLVFGGGFEGMEEGAAARGLLAEVGEEGLHFG